MTTKTKNDQPETEESVSPDELRARAYQMVVEAEEQLNKAREHYHQVLLETRESTSHASLQEIRKTMENRGIKSEAEDAAAKVTKQ
ncbi:hypothetical protein [Photobacterium sp. 1_MG-2023]|uniref:hypothetical protein n=1 Tax=Photobacterium sp. 1_MG-2023 TaxID=3062646 RepID=UPI0026E31F90|nr:hypothetical protein [Photobacterium sp. 1_MG-2023]MDO6706785.1 hypothetical protein [Photobacterium sp. 1_MG-2023]